MPKPRSMSYEALMSYPGLEHHSARVNGVRLHYVTVGKGSRKTPPLYLLHGYPQSWIVWRKLIPLFADRFRLVMPDLRGYGDSDKPLVGYDKRSMAKDVRELARHLGDSHLLLVGHDRGGRVAHRYALDHGDTLTGVILVDIVPTLTFFERVTKETAQGTWHWFFLPVADVAEPLIASNPEVVLRHFLRSWAGDPGAIEEAAVQEYLRTFRMPGTIRANSADYRAGISVDLDQDRGDSHKRIEVPVRVIWGAMGRVERWDPVSVWKEKARSVSGRGIPTSGHFVSEEEPEELAREIVEFSRTL